MKTFSLTTGTSGLLGFLPSLTSTCVFTCAMAHPELCEVELQLALTQIPIPRATRNQSLWYLGHIGKIFYCLLEETMKNQPDDSATVEWENQPEALFKSFTDLKLLTMAFLEGQYVTAARVMVTTKNTSTPRGNAILRFALTELHGLYAHIEPTSCQDTAQWLCNEHGGFLRAEGFELSHLQQFFNVVFPAAAQSQEA